MTQSEVDSQPHKFVITKRLLGVGLVLFGLAAALAPILLDLVGAGRYQGIGPAQRMALLAAGVVIVVGFTLIPLGKRPA